ncbi:UDP-N-acetyl-D-mannosaminuronic acid dehydrogenase [Serinicoccus chungangensis]|uniref:UDP-N-acetyl-D-mannosaminuronic acid dehydrogenase n=1 Tax=Serinicoccus chungangensis TaxID=767452 RepID=A0A0W8IAX5_9MICO|nr:UDP-N-acetyl-D-mannosamine dehydrogenase [Serinicoccus chungangensis]KUG57090.1 UDP-N-acetyl-D-mannosaminuronic acid dehydrogenase [Serinicoccus chungangensis]
MSQSVAVIGLGYIGLPTAAILASHGYRVLGVDVSDRHVDAVNAGRIPFVEPDLSTHVAGAVSRGALSAQKETPAAEVYIIAVPTPFAEGYSADLSYIDAATDGIIPQLKGGELVILESTSPPGATQHVADRITAARPELSTDAEGDPSNVDVAHCPERVLPGRVMIELVENDRIVGGLTQQAAERAKELYSSFCHGEIFLTDAVTAEMAKLTENSFRDVNIAFANELSIIAEKVGIDVFELIELANKHPRVNILQPGPGVGGHCIAVDPWFIVSSVPQQARLIRTAREVNDSKPEYVINQVAAHVEGREAPTVAALGLAFKPDIDDMRESPALDITHSLAERLPTGTVLAVEPNVEALPARLADLSNVQLAPLSDALKRADVIVLLVDHKEFKELAGPGREVPVVDTRGAWR